MKKTITILILLIGFTCFVNAQVMVSTLAGSPTSGNIDGTGTVARFSGLRGICMSSNDILVTELVNQKIRKITPSGAVTSQQYLVQPSNPPFYTSNYRVTNGICRDATGNIFAVSNSSIIKITSSGSIIFDYAGVYGVTGYIDGTIANARFQIIQGICIDPSGNLYVSENSSSRVRKITPSGIVSTFIDTGSGNSFIGLCSDSLGNIYLTGWDNRIYKATPSGTLTIIAGGGSGPGSTAEGVIGTNAMFPNLKGICVDTIGNLYVTAGNNIRKITPSGAVYTFAGPSPSGATLPGYVDGLGTNAKFNGLYDICTDNLGNFYVTDNGNNCVRKISVVPTFTQVSPICSGATLALPTTSNNGITGTWSPAINNTATTTYTFTPSGGNGISTTMTIVVNPNITPTFQQVNSICSGATLGVLPTTSDNGITGTWSPALNNTATTTYTFTPTIGQCATTNTMTITVNPLPDSAGVISGNTTVCQGQNTVTYTVPSIANATSYVWTLPNGATGTSNSNSITVNYGTSAISGNITVKGNNSCGDGLTSTLPIIVNPLPSNAGTISGSTTVCKGQNAVTYIVPTITNATSYIWTLPTGATGTSATNSITVNYGTSAISGNIIVSGNNSCGSGTSSSLPITVINSLPPTGNTSQNFTQGQTLSNLQVTGTNLIWYANQSDAINHVSPITNTTLLVNGATYYVTQTNNGCESAPLGITVTVALGINDFQKDKFIYYPNPVNSVLNFENNNPISKITLFNFLGQIIQEKEINSLSGQLDMSKLPTGNYLLKFKTDNGESTIKLVKN